MNAPLQIGSIVIAKRNAGIAVGGEIGVAYEKYDRGDGTTGWSFIFEEGGYDGFSPDEIDLCLHMTSKVCPEVCDYNFKNVLQLKADYRKGMFANAFERKALPFSPH